MTVFVLFHTNNELDVATYCGVYSSAERAEKAADELAENAVADRDGYFRDEYQWEEQVVDA